jgi:hypothetical protein
MTVHACPFCELRFSFLTELEWHMSKDHDRAWATPERSWVSPEHRHAAESPKDTKEPG